MKYFISITAILALILGCEKTIDNSLQEFGSVEFNSTVWNKSNSEVRAKMIYSFIKTTDIRKLSSKDIYSLLGKSTAYYEYDEFPAYILKSDNKQYILAFPINRNTNKIRKYVLKEDK